MAMNGHHEFNVGVRAYLALGLIGAARSKKISVFHPSPLNVAPKSPNASYLRPPPDDEEAVRQLARAGDV